MIRLNFVTKPIEKQKEVVNNYYEELIIGRSEKFLSKLDKWCENNLKAILLNPELSDRKYKYLEQVIISDYQKLLKIKKNLEKSKLTLTDTLANYMKTTFYNSINKKKFAQNLNISVCPYCNRNFINTSNKGGDCQIDHFFNKSDFPLFSVSLYNLVPVCGSCNYKKLTANFNHSPYDSSLRTDDLIRFSYLPRSIGYLINKEELEIKIEYLYNELLENDMKILELSDLYQIHVDRVAELLKKKIIYNESYVNQIFNKYSDLFEGEYELDNLITDAYVEEQFYEKRPLSKMISDISREIGLIGGEK